MNVQNNTGHVSAVVGPAFDHVTVALSTSIAAPVLRSVGPLQVARLFEERERYEPGAKCKQGKEPMLQATSYKTSVDPALLTHLLFMGYFKEIDPTAIFE